ncbi:acid phosphatase/Vanadium-dependent haloperoxidase, partial [Jaminaea rosea]
LQWSKGKTKTSSRRRLQLVVSYAPDWILTLLLAGMLAFLDTAHGFRREFSLTDPSLQHTYAEHQRVPMWLLVLLAVIVPICIQALISLVVARSFWDFHASLLGLVVTHALTVTTTTIIKISVGRPRPDLIDRCQPRAGATNAPIYGLVTDAICTNPLNEHLVSDGFRSFPSGHSSAAFAGLTFLSLYLGGKFHLFGRKGHAGVSWIVWLPMLGATMIAVSRTMDYRHHATDVIAGGILGAGVAVGTYFLYYPSLWDSRCHKPWAPRVPRYRL